MGIQRIVCSPFKPQYRPFLLTRDIFRLVFSQHILICRISIFWDENLHMFVFIFFGGTYSDLCVFYYSDTWGCWYWITFFLVSSTWLSHKRTTTSQLGISRFHRILTGICCICSFMAIGPYILYRNINKPGPPDPILWFHVSRFSNLSIYLNPLVWVDINSATISCFSRG
jgi:hypothetical protein